MPQSNQYKFAEEVNYLRDLVGADTARDLLKVAVEEGDVTANIADQLNVNIEDQTLTELTTDTGAALTTNDALRVAQPLDVSGTTVPIEISAQTLGSVSIQETTPLDVSGATVTVTEASAVATQPHAATAFENGTALASGGTLSNALSAVGADTLRGRVVRASTSYDVTVDWQDSAGNVLFTDTIASAVTAGTATSLNEPAESPYCTVNVTDAGSASGAVTAQLHLR